MTSIELKIKELIEPIIIDLGYSLYDVIYEKEGKDNYLRIFIDNEVGISLNDCENVNNAITDIMDEKDLIKAQYFLEVSSPGIERRIRDDVQLEKVIDNKIEIHLYKAIEKEKVIIGILRSFDNKVIKIEKCSNAPVGKKAKKNENIKVENVDITIEKSNISNMKTVFNWEEM